MLYADIRAVLGVPMVNLIYRHIATFPGGLAWAWSALRPHIAAREIGPLARDVLAAAARVRWTDHFRVDDVRNRRVIDWYNAGNAINVVALSALRSATVRTVAPAESATIDIPAPAADLMQPLRLADLPPALREKVVSISARQGLAPFGVTPTMYLHLAHAPALLDAILDYVASAIQRGELTQTVAAIIAATELPARQLSTRLQSSVAPPTEAHRREIDAALETFTRIVIPQMIAVGAHLV